MLALMFTDQSQQRRRRQQQHVYVAVIVTRSLREFVRFITLDILIFIGNFCSNSNVHLHSKTPACVYSVIHFCLALKFTVFIYINGLAFENRVAKPS